MAEMERQKLEASKKQVEAEKRAVEEQQRQLREVGRKTPEFLFVSLTASEKVEEKRKKLAELEKKKAELAAQQKALKVELRQSCEVFVSCLVVVKDTEEKRRAMLMKQQDLLRQKAALDQERGMIQNRNVTNLTMAQEVKRMSFFQVFRKMQRNVCVVLKIWFKGCGGAPSPRLRAVCGQVWLYGRLKRIIWLCSFRVNKSNNLRNSLGRGLLHVFFPFFFCSCG